MAVFSIPERFIATSQTIARYVRVIMTYLLESLWNAIKNYIQPCNEGVYTKTMDCFLPPSRSVSSAAPFRTIRSPFVFFEFWNDRRQTPTITLQSPRPYIIVYPIGDIFFFSNSMSILAHRTRLTSHFRPTFQPLLKFQYSFFFFSSSPPLHYHDPSHACSS